jgi:hypothetical protein
MEDTKTAVAISYIAIDNDNYYKISNNHLLRPFFMNIVSDGNHWMFISSNGGLSAGRKNSEYALFPYYTDDKITESADITGSKSLFLIQKNDKKHIWEPFSDRFTGMYDFSRNLYKSVYGNKVIFEEINHDLGLTFRYSWNSSNIFGFVRTSKIINNTTDQLQIAVLDGIQNILPYGVGSDLQKQSSNLVDAYKRSEINKETGLGIYALSAIIVDKAEPSEALKANMVWSFGLDKPKYLLSSLQLNQFRRKQAVHEEVDIKAEKGAYFINADILLEPQSEKEWIIVANVNQTHASVAKISAKIKDGKELSQLIKQDIKLGTQRLIKLNGAADGLQLTSDQYRDTRHFSNVLFNIMRGGTFDNNYQIEKWDFRNYLEQANKAVFKKTQGLTRNLPDIFSAINLKEIAVKNDDADFKRLCFEYMPLKFSRRHGDPSRPWNKFSINTHNEIDGSKILDYEGNWRDIFQNWEALAHSYPMFIESMIHKFLNATTFDGYNPYRVTKDGFDWETIEPDNPWSYIGYWGDHQIIYLLKFLEIIENHIPGKLGSYFNQALFVYADVPYRIKSYEDILKNSKDTIEFDEESDIEIRLQREQNGADAALIHLEDQSIYKVNFIEKILATILAKLSNFIPEGGIWMNTQRPEWNDANNALVGNGVSMVTLNYLRRFLHFFKKIMSDTKLEQIQLSSELITFYNSIHQTFEKHETLLSGKINDQDRKSILDALGQAGSDYRQGLYKETFTGKKEQISIDGLINFVEISLRYIDHTIKANKRQDHLYHAYNLMTIENDEEVSIAYLSEMLEGQVAVLSSGYLSSKESLEVLDALKNSALFRDDQYSYILYPNKELPLFTERNNVPKEAVEKSVLLTQLVADNNINVIEKAVDGHYHFNGNFKNAGDLRKGLDSLSRRKYEVLAEKEKTQILQVFEDIFNHKAFTGRSGTFFGYEGLGSIYWHMVSKLLLAVQECCLKAIRDEESGEIIGRLLEHYYEINEGIGVHKSPSLYGAFPTDPYSHTPAGKGAQQPGMTGQVKEDILCRFGELGVFVKAGNLYFNPCLLRRNEFLEKAKTFNYMNVHSEHKTLNLEKDSLSFTYCQVPIIYKIAEDNGLEVTYKDGHSTKFETLSLDVNTSKQVFERTGDVLLITVRVRASELR